MYCIDQNSDEPILTLFDQIGHDDEHPEQPYVDGNDFAKELLYLDTLGKKRIQIYINSEGGSVKQGFSIISAILNTKTPIDTFVVGIAFSIAGIISLMGRKREAMDYASLMFHNPYNSDGSEDKGLEIFRKSLITAISSRTGLNESEVEKIMSETTFYTASEAEKKGLLTVIPSDSVNKPRSLKKEDIQNFAKTVLNKLIDKPKKESMKVIAKALNLNPEASEEAILSAFNAIKNKADELEEIKNKLAKAEEECTHLRDKIAKMEEEGKAKEKLEEECKAKAQAEEAKNKFSADAKAKIEEAGKSRRLDVKAIAGYVALAKDETSLKTVMETIEAFPIVIKSPEMKFPMSNKLIDKFPMIESVGTDKQGNPIAGDTTSLMNAINSYKSEKNNK